MEPLAYTDRLTIHEPDDARRRRFASRLAAWRREGVARRIWAKDATLWLGPADDAAGTIAGAIADRLGWLDQPFASAEPRLVGVFEDQASAVKAAGVRQVLLCGMGGSSLAPEVLGSMLGAGGSFPALEILDSTHPEAVRAALERHPPASSWYVVASKSGTTVETMAFMRAAWEHVAASDSAPGQRFLAITDPGSSLAELGRERGFRTVCLAPPDVGGRFSALSAFGLLPAAICGVDVVGLLERAREMAAAAGADVPAPENPALILGAALGELAAAGRDKLTIVTSHGLRALPAWQEQLIAESLGKDGRGIVPVIDEPLGRSSDYGDDRVFCQLMLAGEDAALSQESIARLLDRGHPVIRIVLRDRLDVGAEMLRWELAVAAAGTVLGVQPFDQPDVELSKKFSRELLTADGSDRAMSDVPTVTVENEAAAKHAAAKMAAWLDGAAAADYIAVLAFLAPTSANSRGASALRRAIARRGLNATTFGWGPRYLHSTGQLHKGGTHGVRVLQIIDAAGEFYGVPETDYDFGRLLSAQADGDLRALRQRGRQVMRLQLGENPARAIEAVAAALEATTPAGGQTRGV